MNVNVPVARLLGLFLALVPLARADHTIEFGGVTYKFIAHNRPQRAKDPEMSLYAPAGATTAEEQKTAFEVVHWPKEKYPDELGRQWLETVWPRSVEKPVVLVDPHNKRDIIYEVITFFSNPAGQEVDLRRFFRDPDGHGVTSYFARWRFLQVDSNVDDSEYRSRRAALIKELRALKITDDPFLDAQKKS